jgi:EAL domain-containing protein (putative c-di-GMP-specific phosphodiesterase class I)
VRHLVGHGYAGSLILVSGENDRIVQAAEKLVQAHGIPVLGRLQKPVHPDRLSELLEKWVPRLDAGPGAAPRIYEAEALRGALRNAEFVNYYQPKVRLADGEVAGMETLVRWHHPDDGLVPPDRFIGLAEASGLIGELTRQVFAASVTQAAAWRRVGLALPVAVNVAMDDLASLDFLDFVAEFTARAGVPPHDVVLEVTESQLMQDTRAPLEVLTRLRLKRFRIAIDDFGTGHSSLAQLRDLPFDELKIDRGFVHGAWADETLRAMYDASLSLAWQLGMSVVAEGVEDRSDWDWVRRTGCDLAQGAFISAPLQAADVPPWIEAWHRRRPAAEPPPRGPGRTTE